MDKINDNWQYKSGWRPIYIENDSSFTSISANTQISHQKTSPKNQSQKNLKTDNSLNMFDNVDLLKLLNEINTKIDTLNRNLINQNENMNNLFNYFKALETTADKKSVFDFLKKLTE